MMIAIRFETAFPRRGGAARTTFTGGATGTGRLAGCTGTGRFWEASTGRFGGSTRCCGTAGKAETGEGAAGGGGGAGAGTGGTTVAGGGGACGIAQIRGRADG